MLLVWIVRASRTPQTRGGPASRPQRQRPGMYRCRSTVPILDVWAVFCGLIRRGHRHIGSAVRRRPMLPGGRQRTMFTICPGALTSGGRTPIWVPRQIRQYVRARLRRYGFGQNLCDKTPAIHSNKNTFICCVHVQSSVFSHRKCLAGLHSPRHLRASMRLLRALKGHDGARTPLRRSRRCGRPRRRWRHVLLKGQEATYDGHRFALSGLPARL